MKKFFALIACAIAFCMVMPTMVYAEKKKAKKEKKPYVWVMPELSGNSDFDEYLLKCDTLYSKIQSYCDSIVFYEIAEITVIDENGEKDTKYQVVDEAGTLRSSNLAFQQNLNLVMAYPGIALEMTEMAALTATATATLPSLGLKALAYGKYIKAGPKIIGLGGTEMKKIYKKARAQAKQIKALKKGKIDEVKALQAQVKGGDVEAGAASLRTLEMSKADYEAQFGKLTEEDAKVGDVVDQDIPEEEI